MILYTLFHNEETREIYLGWSVDELPSYVG